MEAIKKQLDVIMSGDQKMPEKSCIESLFSKLSSSFDEESGGFGGAPRFPQPSMWTLLWIDCCIYILWMTVQCTEHPIL